MTIAYRARIYRDGLTSGTVSIEDYDSLDEAKAALPALRERARIQGARVHLSTWVDSPEDDEMEGWDEAE